MVVKTSRKFALHLPFHQQEAWMPKLTFYRQKRFDGGIRTGLEWGFEFDATSEGDATLLERFEPGDEDRDPSLLWFVDIRCDGPGVPRLLEEAPRWFLSTKPVIDDGLARFADHLRRVGSDLDDYPLEWSEFPNADDVERKIVCSANRRIECRELAEILDDVRDHWSEWIEEMIEEQAASPRN
jgi:hypothetical protein